MMHSTARSYKHESESSVAIRGGNGLKVLARVPDMAVPAIELWHEPKPDPWHSRLWTPALRKNLLLGAGAMLVLATIVPFMTRRDKPTPSILPPQDTFTATSSDDASKSWADYARPTADKPSSSVADLAGVAPRTEEPPRPAAPVVDKELASQTPPSPSPWPNNTVAKESAVQERTPAAEPIRGLPQPGNPGAPAGTQDRYPLAGGSSNRPMSLGNPPAAPSNGYPREGLADRQMSPPPSGLASPFEPGTARFEGTIEKPSVRTTYDRPRPGIY